MPVLQVRETPAVEPGEEDSAEVTVTLGVLLYQPQQAPYAEVRAVHVLHSSSWASRRLKLRYERYMFCIVVRGT